MNKPSPPQRKGKNAKTQLIKWRDGFLLVPSTSLFEAPNIILNRTGVYTILFKYGEAVADLSGYNLQLEMPLWTYNEFCHLYTGESVDIRNRVQTHLAGSIALSNLRHTLLAIQWCTGALSMATGLSTDLAVNESALTAWLVDHTMVAFKTCPFVRDVEADILKRAGSPLNISGRSAKPYAKALRSMRKKFAADIQAARAGMAVSA